VTGLELVPLDQATAFDFIAHTTGVENCGR
jgi:hypothetical protein